jgi:hypothetical protein
MAVVRLIHNGPLQEATVSLSAQQIMESFEELPKSEKNKVAYISVGDQAKELR